MLLSDAKTFSISAENPTGEKGNGGKEIPDNDSPASRLGKGWKVKPCISLKPGETATLADIKCTGFIQHIWMTVDPKTYRNLILRMYWDDEKSPSVEVPLGDFFVNMHGLRYPVNSLPIVVNPKGGFNSYWQMPFRKNARITITNDYFEEIPHFFFQITYTQVNELPENTGYFHAQWRRTLTTRENPEHVIISDIIGKGLYVGTAIGWSQMSNGWWGEGEIKFFIDDDDEYPTICGTGTEDYFGGAWCFGETYSTPFLGYPLWRKEPNEIPKHGLYRWHIPDPIRFSKNLKVTIQALGWYPDRKFQPLTDDIASVAYWYQSEPHAAFPKLLDFVGRFPR
jgi:hypothetical protein